MLLLLLCFVQHPPIGGHARLKPWPDERQFEAYMRASAVFSALRLRFSPALEVESELWMEASGRYVEAELTNAARKRFLETLAGGQRSRPAGPRGSEVPVGRGSHRGRRARAGGGRGRRLYGGSPRGRRAAPRPAWPQARAAARGEGARDEGGQISAAVQGEGRGPASARRRLQRRGRGRSSAAAAAGG
ncbi:unnamed protein product, partial [Prorocentrum cordatum]